MRASKSEILFYSKRLCSYINAATFDGADLSHVKLPGNLFMPIVSKFCYLGRFFARSGGDAVDVNSRIEAAGKAFGALRGCVFSSTHINSQAKKIVYVTLIRAHPRRAALHVRLGDVVLHGEDPPPAALLPRALRARHVPHYA